MPLNPASLLDRSRIVPVVTVDAAPVAVALGRALMAGGLSVIEVTLRTPAALACIRALKAEVPGLVVGAGTITSSADLGAAVEAGAAFVATPGTPDALAAALEAAPVPALPGCATVTEAMALSARGFATLKFFPAEANDGRDWLRAVAGPLPGLAFCPTGGIDAAKASSYLALPNVIAVGGSWMAPDACVAARDFDAVTRLARAAADLIR